MIRGEIRGLEAAVSGLRDFDTSVKVVAFQAVRRGLEQLAKASLKEITATDHSLAVLRAMGHPYAKRHPDPPHSDPVIHIQSGEYVQALRVYPPIGLAGAIVEGKIKMDGDANMAVLDRRLQQGTTVMIARPWMRFVTDQVGPAILEAVKAEIANAIKARGLKP